MSRKSIEKEHPQIYAARMLKGLDVSISDFSHLDPKWVDITNWLYQNKHFELSLLDSSFRTWLPKNVRGSTDAEKTKLLNWYLSELGKIDPLRDDLQIDVPLYRAQFKSIFDAFQDETYPEDIVKGIIDAQSLVVAYGQPGIGKSMLLLDMALDVATGRNWLAGDDVNAGFATKRGCVLWLDQDSGSEVIKERVRAFCRQKGIDPADQSVNFKYLAFPDPAIDLTRYIDDLAESLEDLDPVLVVYDNLISFSAAAEENTDSVSKAFIALRKINERIGCASLVIHHPSKDKYGGQNGGLRGHSSILGAVDAVYKITESGDIRHIKQEKARRRPVGDIAAQWSFSQDADGFLQTAKFEMQDAAKIAQYEQQQKQREEKQRESEKQKRYAEERRWFLDVISKHSPNGIGLKELQAAFDAAGFKSWQPTKERAISALLDAGLIFKTPEPRKYRFYKNPNPSAEDMP